MMPELQEIGLLVSVWALPLLVAITFHEAAHGFVAWRLGDDTAYRKGRVTFNPLRHIDPFGTIILPVLLLLVTSPFGSPFVFGFAKPVPVAFGRLRNPRLDTALVAIAGPATNVLLALASVLLLHLVGFLPQAAGPWAVENLRNSVWINAILAVFNMLPLPPLDGGRIAVSLLPYRLALPVARLERYGLPILLGFLFLLPMAGRELGRNLDFLTPVIVGGAATVVRAVAYLGGMGGPS